MAPLRKYTWPLISVLAGLAVSYGLQALGVEPMWAKLAGLAGVAAVLLLWWRGIAHAR
jgi:hypothetical protein